MTEDADERLWPARLRWRMRGAWQWPTFAVATLADAVLMHLLPFAGDDTSLVGGFLLAGFFNLIAVAALAPVAGWLLRRRRPALPRVIAADRAGTALVAGVTALLLAGGILHRPAVQADRDDFAAQAAAVRRYAAAQAPRAYRANVDRADTWQQGPGLFRTCIPGPDPRKNLCLIVTTSQRPPGVVLDPDQQPNAKVAGPDNPGRKAR